MIHIFLSFLKKNALNRHNPISGAGNDMMNLTPRQRYFPILYAKHPYPPLTQ
jgi:hypothetical protein